MFQPLSESAEHTTCETIILEQPQEEQMNEIHAAVHAYADAWRCGDYPAMVALYHDDFSLHYPGDHPLAGAHRGEQTCLQVLRDVRIRTNRQLVEIVAVMPVTHGAQSTPRSIGGATAKTRLSTAFSYIRCARGGSTTAGSTTPTSMSWRISSETSFDLNFRSEVTEGSKRWNQSWVGRMIRFSEQDYGCMGLSVQEAFVEAGNAYRREHPKSLGETCSIVWDGRDIITGDILRVPHRGRFRIDFVSCRPTTLHGVDIEVPGGGIMLKDGTDPTLLRTWYGSWYEPELEWVEYRYHAPEGQMRLTTVSERASGRVERWTGNAGMFVECLGAQHRVYHCSHADSFPPNFEDMVVALTVRADE